MCNGSSRYAGKSPGLNRFCEKVLVKFTHDIFNSTGFNTSWSFPDVDRTWIRL